MKNEIDLDVSEILPYDTNQFLNGMNRLLNSPLLAKLVQTYFPDLSVDEFIESARKIPNIRVFQEKIISKTINAALAKTSSGFKLTGQDRLSHELKYVFISNHRDIICDPALFTNGIFLSGFETPKICLGDNLLKNQTIIDLVKMNKGITVKRNLSTRELFKWSHVLSSLIRQQILEKTDSVWLAQREGRAKDGNDFTHPGILKMLALSGEGQFLERIKCLHLVPVSVSYEYDPCDAFKARELYVRSHGFKYEKSPNEDVLSMIAGIQGFKGGIQFNLGQEIEEAIEDASKLTSKHDQIEKIVNELDRQIILNYKLWPSNYIAYDLISEKEEMKDHYTFEKKQEFIDRMHKQISSLKVQSFEYQPIQKYLLQIYSNPVINSRKYASF